MSESEPLLRVRDVAARLQLSRRSIWRYIASGRLEAVRLPNSQWRIRSASLRALEGLQGASGQAAQDGEQEPEVREADGDVHGEQPREHREHGHVTE